MKMKDERDIGMVQEHDAIGIVVRDRAASSRRPKAVAFVWGGEVRPAPSLPYGRWKKVLSAA